MTNVDLSSYKGLYVQTARKYVSDMQRAHSTLQTDKTNKEAIDTMHLSAHSLKSQSQIMGFAETGALCGTIETLFRPIHEGTNNLSDEVLNPLGEALKNITASIDSVETNGKEIELTAITDTMKSFIPNTK